MANTPVIQTLAFNKDNIVQTFKELKERATNLNEALEWIDDQESAARVLQTVAYVVVDEDEFGQPVVEKWAIKFHSVFPSR